MRNDYQVREKLAKGTMPPRNKKNFRATKKGGGFKKCGRKSASGSKRKYPKCVPAAKAASMTDSQRRSAVARKRSKAQGVGGKPTNVKTFAKRA